MISSMLQYIQKSPDCFHAVENLRQRLMGEGYTQLTAGEWSLTPGGKYFITKNGSSLLAFRVPQGAPTGFVLTASHSDSPCFRLRDHAELAGEFVRLSAERYGGMINDCWLDRPLSAAGRVLVRRDNGLETRLVDLKKDMALIPRVAIHLNRDGNNGTKYNPAQDLVALYAGGEQKGCFDREIAAAPDASRRTSCPGSVPVQQPAGHRVGACGRIPVRTPAGRPGLCICLHPGLPGCPGDHRHPGAVRI